MDQKPTNQKILRYEWVKRIRSEWDEHVTRMDVTGLVIISRDIIIAGRTSLI